jgi:hypothetical protein
MQRYQQTALIAAAGRACSPHVKRMSKERRPWPGAPRAAASAFYFGGGAFSGGRFVLCMTSMSQLPSTWRCMTQSVKPPQHDGASARAFRSSHLPINVHCC